MTDNYKQDEKDAAELQEMLYELKNYEKKQSTGEKTIFEEKEYEAFVQSYGRVVNNKNFKFSNFLKRQGGRSLELALARISVALKDINEGQIEQGKTLKNHAAKLITGGNYNIVEIPVEDITNNIVQTALQKCEAKAKNWYQAEIKKGKSDSTVAYVNPKQAKVDVYTDRVIFSTEMEIKFPNLSRFAKLYGESTLTAKNYKEQTYRKGGIELGNTNMFTILYQTLEYNGFFNNNKTISSFIIALYKRKDNQLVNSSSVKEDTEIESHFNHMQTIFELTGVGQNYYTRTGEKTLEINQLNDLLKQGAKFLVYNQWDSDKIIVQSTKAILYKRLQSELGNSSKFNRYRF